LDRKLAKQFVDRWHAVAKIEKEELQQLLMEMRLAQTIAAMGLWKGLGLINKDDHDPKMIKVRNRWTHLKKLENG